MWQFPTKTQKQIFVQKHGDTYLSNRVSWKKQKDYLIVWQLSPTLTCTGQKSKTVTQSIPTHKAHVKVQEGQKGDWFFV